MRIISMVLGVTVLTVMIGMGLSTLALSGTDRTVYDKPTLQPGKIIKGTVMNVDEKSSQTWNVSVKDRETGEVVILHIDKSTTRKSNRLQPDLGDYVIAQYNEHNNHAYSFLTNDREHN
ncbi:MAG TPA: hypothetical protein VFU48_05280 [Nitrospira sp.]|nr:hypothetical protein [Nitrospira sp.]